MMTCIDVVETSEKWKISDRRNMQWLKQWLKQWTM
jgi:hypothetical protein